MKLLFVCSRNQWRSPTAEEIFKNHPFVHARSAGTANSARIKISEKLLIWADMIFVMEKKHKQQIQQRFQEISNQKEIIILHIPDEFQFMDQELIQMIETSVEPFLPASY